SVVRGLVAEVTRDAAAGATTLALRHLFGIQQGLQVTIVNGTTGQIIGQPAVSAYNGTLGTITLNPALAEEVRVARGDVVVIAPLSLASPNQPPTDPANASATFRAKALGEWGNGVQAQIRPMVGATMRLPSPTAGLAITTLSKDVAANDAQVSV